MIISNSPHLTTAEMPGRAGGVRARGAGAVGGRWGGQGLHAAHGAQDCAAAALGALRGGQGWGTIIRYPRD